MAATRRLSSTDAPADIEGRSHVAAQESKHADDAELGRTTLHRVREGPPSPAAAAEAAGDWGLAAALRISAAAVEGRAHIAEQNAGRFETGVVGAQERKHANDAGLGRAFYGTGGTGGSQARSTEGRGDGVAAAGGDDGNGAEVAREEERAGSAPAVAGAGNGDDAAAEEKEEEPDIEGGSVEEGGKRHEHTRSGRGWECR